MENKQDEIGGYSLAQTITGLCVGTLYSKVSKKEIPHFRVGARLVRFSRVDLEQWMNQLRVPNQLSNIKTKR